jgi:hypothetical protein
MDLPEFEFGLDLILDGLEKIRVKRPRRAPALATARRSPRTRAAKA